VEKGNNDILLFCSAAVVLGLNTLATLARAFSFAAAGMSAARSMHQRQLAAVLAAPMAFFDANPAGRILNRCGWSICGWNSPGLMLSISCDCCCTDGNL
jgi:ATP-binding cassette subfamily C (CFTR/MRP) protein 10